MGSRAQLNVEFTHKRSRILAFSVISYLFSKWADQFGSQYLQPRLASTLSHSSTFPSLLELGIEFGRTRRPDELVINITCKRYTSLFFSKSAAQPNWQGLTKPSFR